MKVLAINGSPRKGWNTHILLEKALEGAKCGGADTELVNLYDINFKGCVSCFACKRKGILLDTCALRDELLPVLQKIKECDALILGSPVYFTDVTGEMRSFIERLCYPYISYDNKPPSFGKVIKTAFIYTMNCPENEMELMGHTQMYINNETLMTRVFGYSEILLSTETWQFDDYDKYASGRFNVAQRKQRRDTVFPQDCENAFALGKRFAEKI